MTTLGENRRRYSLEVERAPSRYFEPAAYREWCTRADAWAETNRKSTL